MDAVEGKNLSDGVKKLLIQTNQKQDASLTRSLSFGASNAKLADKRSRLSRIPTEFTIKLNKVTLTETEDVLFDLLSEDKKHVTFRKFMSALKSTGLWENDPRLHQCMKKLHQLFSTDDTVDDVLNHQQPEDERTMVTNTHKIDRSTFKECVSDNIFLITKALKNDFIIPEFGRFTRKINEIYESCKCNTNGKVADYIPQLKRRDPSLWGVSLCTIDGQRHSRGDTKRPFTIQSCSKPLNYSLACNTCGVDVVHGYVGQEPSGQSFNQISLDSNHQPHNPMINSGAILTCALLQMGMSSAERFDWVTSQYKKMAGNEFIGFSNGTYLSERETADRNFALAYYMRENKCFPDGADLTKTLEFYFQLCSVEVTCESASVIAATLANGGICPLTGERVLDPVSVQNTLSLMYSCGMYDYSGKFAFRVGLPGKSGVAGAILLVVPNIMGICCWSPSLDECGNSMRGVQFCQELVEVFNFHNYDCLAMNINKIDPTVRKTDQVSEQVVNLLFAAASGDVTAIGRFYLSGTYMAIKDYDGRTALHVAAAEGHLHVVQVLVEKCGVPIDPRDRWGSQPIDDAKRFGHKATEEYLKSMRVRSDSVPEDEENATA